MDFKHEIIISRPSTLKLLADTDQTRTETRAELLSCFHGAVFVWWENQVGEVSIGGQKLS